MRVKSKNKSLKLSMTPLEVQTAIERAVQAYAEALKAHFGNRLVSLVLFGSVARGEATPHSDIDMLIVVSGLPPGRLARQRLLEPVDQVVDPLLAELREQGIWTDLSPVLKTPEEARRITPLYFDMVEDARILYDRDGFFAAVLDELRAAFRRLGAKRRRLGRIRYWDLKPDYTPGEIVEI